MSKKSGFSKEIPWANWMLSTLGLSSWCPIYVAGQQGVMQQQWENCFGVYSPSALPHLRYMQLSCPLDICIYLSLFFRKVAAREGEVWKVGCLITCNDAMHLSRLCNTWANFVTFISCLTSLLRVPNASKIDKTNKQKPQFPTSQSPNTNRKVCSNIPWQKILKMAVIPDRILLLSYWK